VLLALETNPLGKTLAQGFLVLAVSVPLLYGAGVGMTVAVLRMITGELALPACFTTPAVVAAPPAGQDGVAVAVTVTVEAATVWVSVTVTGAAQVPLAPPLPEAEAPGAPAEPPLPAEADAVDADALITVM
jgi:hypothetical protein